MSTTETAVQTKTTTKKITIGRLPRTSAADFQFTLPNAPRVTVPTHVSTPKAPVAPMAPMYINAKDYLKNKFVGDPDGEKIYPLVREGLAQGRKVIISVKDLCVYGGFWDTAVCKAYGEFKEEVVDKNIHIADAEDVDLLGLEDMKDIRKLYYYDRETFDEIMDNIDPSLQINDEDLNDDLVFTGTDKYAPYDSHSFYRKSQQSKEKHN
jgi:hypothetical protein